MDRPEPKYIEWYLVFTEAKFNHWIWRFVDKSMGHVYAVRELNEYQWLVVQPRMNFTDTRILLKCQYPVVRALTNKDDKIVKVLCDPELKPRGGLCWFTCVEQVKALIGLKAPLLLTPKQLYKFLMGV